MKIKLNFENIILLLVIMIGISISIYQFIYNRSLWLDESFLALNIMNRSHFELLQPLDYCQVAPILFLQIEKLFSILLGNSEFVLRLFPLICYWVSIYFVYKILKALSLNNYVIIMSLSLYIFNETIIYYSSEVKQYMIDVLVLTGIYYFILKSYSSVRNKYCVLGVLGAISIFLSNISPIVLFFCGMYLFYEDFKGKRKEFKYIMAVSVIWSIIFAIYFLFFIYNHPTREFMLGFWSLEGAFMPTNLFDQEFYIFVIKKYYAFFHDLFAFGSIGFYGFQILFLLGCFNLMEKKKLKILVISIGPLLLHLALSSMKLYPFDIRLILYTCPLLLIIISYSFEYVIHFISMKNKHIVKYFCILTVLFFLFTTYVKLPLERSELKKGFVYLNKNIQDNDKIFVSNFSKFPLQYYQKISKINFPNNKVYCGNLGDYDDFNQEVMALEGRVWFVFSDYTGWDRNLMNLMIKHFDDKKHLLLQEYHPVGASVLLYDIQPK